MLGQLIVGPYLDLGEWDPFGDRADGKFLFRDLLPKSSHFPLVAFPSLQKAEMK